MKLDVRKWKMSIWALALGYFAFYVPYGALTKALSKGLIPGAKPISGFEMLPAVVVGSVLLMLLVITLMGWWKYATHHKVLGLNIPFVSNRWTLYSGIGTAFIIVTTTLAYSFEGISIIFAALLMRGGVLIMAPVIDTIFKRQVNWYSWVALGLSLLALLLIFAEKGGYTLTVLAVLNIGLYLSGYIFRLRFMTRIAKSANRDANYRFFVEEMLVAIPTILILPFVFLLLGFGNGFTELARGLAVFTEPATLFPALLIGVLYGCLYLFGTRIYLNHRENTFCIPINRCASLLAGVVASLGLSALVGLNDFSTVQLVSSGVLLSAVLFLSAPEFLKFFGIQMSGGQNSTIKYVFVCPGNTGRSPMAQAICISKVEQKLRENRLEWEGAGIEIMSLGLNPKEGAPLSEDAIQTLQELGIELPGHIATKLTRQHVDEASRIFCMSEEHRKEIVSRFPTATFKCHCLDPENNVPNPHGQGQAAYRKCAAYLSVLIDREFEQQRIQVEYAQ